MGFLIAECADGSIPHVELDAEDEKNREGNGVVIRGDLAKDLRRWLARMLADFQAKARDRGEPIPARLPGDTRIFNVPTGLIRIFDGDLTAAGIAKRDERGRTLDVHALRTTFGTLLSRGGVPLRTAQTAKRHADPSLTANVNTDPKLLDVFGALDALPSLPLDGGPNADREQARASATGTCDDGAVALLVALPGDKRSKTASTADKMNRDRRELMAVDGFTANPEKERPSAALTTDGNSRPDWAMRDSYPRHPARKAGALTN